ncbi:probable salivary secreted peptide [Osmia bicornis bicornis]|uniref:probable salivary secreted peptide n=1 Tax=Osmia bicornis bicornis TaxID=1437191 RepID=UPI0010F4D27B|nr:probable salivary secreted peptide [Osmia bicornis bicornis]
MSTNKLIFYLAIVAITAIFSQVSSTPYGSHYAANNTNKSHHLIVGSRMPGDRITLRENIVKSSSWMQIVTVQKTFNVSRWERITQVQALDQKTNGNGAFASILNGGPGFSNVTLRFKSQRGHGINFNVQIFTRT